jgi:hypothetical protein
MCSLMKVQRSKVTRRYAALYLHLDNKIQLFRSCIYYERKTVHRGSVPIDEIDSHTEICVACRCI